MLLSLRVPTSAVPLPQCLFSRALPRVLLQVPTTPRLAAAYRAHPWSLEAALVELSLLARPQPFAGTLALGGTNCET
uniref:Uncharacterized protein n=1 Tax=Arundo donax TaxID=35708 RepID=A0A0A9HY22_ARUDO